jgi:tetratricopeptide (TPR) repeat protein
VDGTKIRTDEGVAAMSEDKSNGPVGNRDTELLMGIRKLPSLAWKLLKLFPSWYSAVFVMAAYALWEARTPVTMIAPFQVAKPNLPFTGEIVADAVQDGLKSIRNDVDEERRDAGLRSSDTGLPDLRNMLIPDFWRVQAPPRFTVEVKGMSYERILSLARSVLGTETTITGDVVLKEDSFILIARAPEAGPWESAPRPINAEGLKQASRDLAEKILITRDPTVAGVAMLKDGRVDEGLDLLSRARSLNPSDDRLKLNLCMGFAASRRYDEAIECYKYVLQMKPDSPYKVQEQLAQVYYLRGLRDNAIKIYEDLVYKEGYRSALLGLGEAKDDTGDHGSALTVYNEFLSTERQDRNRAIAHVKRGLAFARMRRHNEALDEYEEALKYAPGDVLILVHRGLERAEATDLDAGIAQLKSVIDENQGSDSLPFARLQLGALLEKKGDWRGALGEYEKAAQLRPTYVEAHLKLAHALVHEGYRAKALDRYKEVAKLSASDLERGYSEVFANQWLANDLRDLGNYNGAASAYRDAIQFKSDNSAAHCQLALILARQGRLPQAVREYGKALVPAKLEELNDNACLVIVDHVLEQAVTSRGSRQVLEAANELRTIKRGTKESPSPSAIVENVPRPTDKGKVVEQAVLRTSPR